jgi:hypothetical protein
VQNSGNSSGEELENNDDNDGGGDEAGGRASFAQALAREVGDLDAEETAGDESKSGKGGEQPKGPPKDLNELAERLGVKVSDLYGMAIPTGHGREPLTLGKVKDRYDSWASLEADRLAASEERVRGDAELTRARQELQELMSVIPREQLLNKEVLQRVAARVAARNQALDAQVIEAIPAWKDETIQTTERKDITTMLEGYGLTAPEVKAIRDPRLVKFLRDAVRREQQVRKALASVQKVTKKPQQQTNAAGAHGPTRQRGMI